MEETIVGVEAEHPAGVGTEVSGETGDVSNPNSAQERQAVEPDQAQFSTQRQPPPGYERVIPELWPLEDGTLPKMSLELMSRLRGKYFTVRHSRLQVCGHKADQINQPKNNCPECWGWFFSSHPELCKVADEFFQKFGKSNMIKMRGEKFVRFFVRFMSLLYQEAKRRQDAQEEIREEERVGVKP
jgi:hypothetical protein